LKIIVKESREGDSKKKHHKQATAYTPADEKSMEEQNYSAGESKARYAFTRP